MTYSRPVSEKAQNASIRGWGLFVVGAVLFLVGIGADSVPLEAIGLWSVIIGIGFLAYGRVVRARSG